MIRSEQIALGYSTLKLSIYLTLVMTYLIWTGSSDLMVEFKWNGKHRTKSGLTVHDYCCSPPSPGISAVGGTWEEPCAPWTTLDAGWKSQEWVAGIRVVSKGELILPKPLQVCRNEVKLWLPQGQKEFYYSVQWHYPWCKIPRKNKTEQNKTKGIFPGCLVQLLSHPYWNFIWIQANNSVHWLLYQTAVAVLSQLVDLKGILNIVLGKI